MSAGPPSGQPWTPRGDLFDQLNTWDRQMGARDSASSSSSSSNNSGRGSGGRAGSSDAPCHGAAGPLSISPMFPPAGRGSIFRSHDLSAGSDRGGGVLPQVRIGAAGLQWDERRRRRAERLSRLPMGVVPDAGAEVLASAPSKGGKHPAVDNFRGVDPGRPGRLVLLVSVRVARATHLRQEKKSRRLKRARSKILCPCKIRRVSLQHQQH